MQSNDVVLSYFNCLLRKSDVELLKGPYWLNDVLIGFYFEYLDQKCNKSDKKEILFVCPELTQILKMTDPLQYSIFLDPLGASEANFIFFPLNDCNRTDKAGGSHWSLLLYCRGEKCCYHFDSSNGSNSRIASDFAKTLIRYTVGKSEKKLVEINCPQQNNGYDCGIHVLCMTDIILEYVLRAQKIDGCDYNKAKQLVQTKRSQLLELIYELQSVTNS